MIDIVERLRYLYPRHPLIMEAAAEIEKLRAQMLQHAETCKESAWPLGEPK